MWGAESCSVRKLTDNQPFCAGVVLIDEGRLTVTLNVDGLPETWRHTNSWRIGGVGGGQELGETMWQCAEREAREELSATVEIVEAPFTFLHDLDTGNVLRSNCTDALAPMLLQRKSRTNPDQPFRPGHPTGPYLYLGLFLAKRPNGPISPGDDVQGLLHVPLEAWPLLAQSPTLAQALEAGAQLTEASTLDRLGRLYLPEDETVHTLATLLLEQPELLRQLVHNS